MSDTDYFHGEEYFYAEAWANKPGVFQVSNYQGTFLCVREA
jgi:hypothetical protein